MISPSQYATMLARTSKNAPPPTADEKEIGHGGLHEKIEEYARSKGWVVVHSRTDKPTTTARGVCDFILAAQNGVTFWIECKRRGSKPTTDQLGTVLALKLLGHRAAIVYSLQEFLDFIASQP